MAALENSYRYSPGPQEEIGMQKGKQCGKKVRMKQIMNVINSAQFYVVFEIIITDSI